MITAPSTETTRILHIDADDDYALLVEESIRQSTTIRCRIDRESGVAEAIERLTRQKFDVVLIEPTIFGDDTLPIVDRICHLAGTAPVIVLTAEADPSLPGKLLRLGVQDHLHKGRVDGESIQRSIRFSITRKATQRQLVVTGPERQDGPLRILLIEDNPGDALLVQESLTECLEGGCEVIQVTRLSDALDRLAAETYCAAILDLSLPDSRGIETCRAVRQQSPQLPFIIHSGSNDEALAIKTIQQGASDYLIKDRSQGGDVARSIRYAIERYRHAAKRSDRFAVRSVDPDQAASETAADRQAWSRGGAGIEKRSSARYDMVRSAILIPIHQDGAPDWDHRLPAVTSDISSEGVGLDLDTAPTASRDFVLGVERHDGVVCYAGICLKHTGGLTTRPVHAGAAFGGKGLQILSPQSLSSAFDPVTLRFGHATSPEILAAWCDVGVLRRAVVDRLQVCPRCFALPTFRLGCRSCGSGRTDQDQLIHHFACAHVGPASEFDQPAGLSCPKCRVRHLIVGSDYEYQSGRVRCQDCHWSGSGLEAIGQCLRCGFRFPGGHAFVQEVTAHHVQRLDPLAFIASS